MAEGAGNAPASVKNRTCFQDRRSQLVSACLPEKMVGNAGNAPVRRLPVLFCDTRVTVEQLDRSPGENSFWTRVRAWYGLVGLYGWECQMDYTSW